MRQLHKGPQLDLSICRQCIHNIAQAMQSEGHIALASGNSVMTVTMMHAAELQLTSITQQTLIAL